MALLCCPLLVYDVHRALTDASAARDLGADLVEYRLDEFFTGGGGSGGVTDGRRVGQGERGEIDAGDSDDDANPGRSEWADTPRDLQSEIAAVIRLISESPLPCIATCRPTWEGGAYDGPEDARISLFEALGTLAPPRGHPPRYIDVELATYARSANIRQKVHLAVDHPFRGRDLAPSLILSIHDFDGRPADLSRRMLAAQSHEACRVLKVAYRARSLRDNLELFDVLDGRDRPTIALGMGEFGLMSRVLAPKFGGFLTFASLRGTQTTAPGQPTIGELLGTYRFRGITARTRVYGVVGWPVAQSLSPAIHNAGFEATGFGGGFMPLPIAGDTTTTRDEPVAGARAGESSVVGGPRDSGAGASGGSSARGESSEDAYISFKATMLSLIEYDRLDFSGCSVTLPHKENLVRLARERGWSIDPIAARCGAANTLVVDRESGATNGPRGCRVLNTDAAAARTCLEGAVGMLEGKRVALIGAGGVSRAIAAACSAAGAGVVVVARRRAQADRLVADLGTPAAHAGSGAAGAITAADFSAISDQAFDAVINATPVGMRHGPDATGLAAPVAEIAARHPATVFFDTVYNPIDTPMLVAARAAGCRAISGLEMFVRQAAGQFSAWTGSPAPMALFERIARESVG